VTTETSPAPVERTGSAGGSGVTPPGGSEPPSRPHPARLVLQVLLAAGCLVVLAVAALRGYTEVNTQRALKVRTGYENYRQWNCLAPRLSAAVPPGARVFVNPYVKDVNLAAGTHEPWSLMAYSLPGRALVAAPEPGAYELSLATTAGTPAQAGDCGAVRLVVRELP
jgi:hypothetical protein